MTREAKAEMFKARRTMRGHLGKGSVDMGRRG